MLQMISFLITDIHDDTTTTSTEAALSTLHARHWMVNRSQTGSLKFSSRYALHLRVDPKDVEPSCFSKAIKHAEWRTVMATYFSALHSDGSIERYKACLVANGKPISTPCISGRQLSLHYSEPILDPSKYRQVVGALQYPVITSPDLSYVVNQVCVHALIYNSALACSETRSVVFEGQI
ncbi:unnamed protein product [Prunus armeniaca]|uniref:Uncharacterized protein n=2 Tax=Prunus armeniaca TaxID=36596 RepID=A0A6J5XL29_PRUAR|nr:unnamed protein product [Prunus armeniaca]